MSLVDMLFNLKVLQLPVIYLGNLQSKVPVVLYIRNMLVLGRKGKFLSEPTESWLSLAKLSHVKDFLAIASVSYPLLLVSSIFIGIFLDRFIATVIVVVGSGFKLQESKEKDE